MTLNSSSMWRISPKDDIELMTERKEKREKNSNGVGGYCNPIRAPELDRNGSPKTIFSNNNNFDRFYNNSSSGQGDETPQRRRAHSDAQMSKRTCIDQTNPYLGYFVFAAEDQPMKKSPDKKGRDFFQRYNLLSNEKIRARKDRKLNPLRGILFWSNFESKSFS